MGGCNHDAFHVSVAAQPFYAAARVENSPHIPAPAVQRAAAPCVGGPYRLEPAHGAEQRRQRRRLALAPAIATAQSGDTIVFDPSLSYETITLSSGPLAISSNLTIDGLGANLLSISGNHASRLFTLSGTAQVSLANLTLTGGMSSQGGAILIGGTAALTLDSDILSGNQAVGDANGDALGGAVYNSVGASLAINNTSSVNNQTNGTNVSFGGAIANAGTLAIDGATFTGNAALGSKTSEGGPEAGGSQGGAIGNLDGSTASIALSTFTGNQALGTGTGDAVGGAIANQDATTVPFTGLGISMTLSQCTFANNTAQGGSKATDGGQGGGAIEDQSGVNLAVLNYYVTGNQATSPAGTSVTGGAIDNSNADSISMDSSVHQRFRYCKRHGQCRVCWCRGQQPDHDDLRLSIHGQLGNGKRRGGQCPGWSGRQLYRL